MVKCVLAGLLVILGVAPFVCVADSVPTTNQVVFVDQDNKLSSTAVASLQAQMSNEVAVIVMSTKAAAAAQAAQEATNLVADVVASIVQNDVRIFRKGNMSSFAPLIIVTEDDTLTICSFEVDNKTGISTIGYVSTVNWGTMKPVVRATDTLTSPTSDWAQVDDSLVSAVTVHAESKTIAGVTYTQWYSFTVNTGVSDQYYYTIEMNPDTPQGEGITLDIKNGVTGGYTGTITDGSLTKTYVGGILMEVK